MLFVSSWDDGHPLDCRVAELYAARGLRTTFFVPLQNREGRKVLSTEMIRSLDKAGFELASHTEDHRYLDKLETEEVQRQIIGGKHGLEDIVGHEIRGFCYPGGRLPLNGNILLRDLGFAYARTVENLRIDGDFSRYLIPTTIQFYPHTRSVLLRNALRYRNHGLRKLKIIWDLSKQGSIGDRVVDLIQCYRASDAIFHIWGHSWEVDANDYWADLDRTLDLVVKLGIPTVTVAELCDRIFGKLCR